MRGRKPQPRAVLKLRNSAALRQDLHKRPEPEIPSEGLVCPSWLDSEAKACWKRISAILLAAGVLKVSDRESLVGYCLSWSTVKQTSKALDAITDFGGRSYRQLQITRNDALAKILRFAEQFGLTPSARTRIDMDVEGRKLDAFDLFLGSKQK